MDAYSDIKIASEMEGDYYFQLADYHFSFQRFQESLNATKNAIAQYAALEDMTPGRQSPGKHFRAVVFLCRNHFILKQYDACTTEGFRALQLLDNLSVRLDHIALVDVHTELLDKMMEALREMANLKALEWARNINSHIEGPGDTTANRQNMLYTTFLNLADGYADSGNVDEALRHLSNAKDALSKREIANAEEGGSDVHSYQVISIKKARLI